MLTRPATRRGTLAGQPGHLRGCAGSCSEAGGSGCDGHSRHRLLSSQGKLAGASAPAFSFSFLRGFDATDEDQDLTTWT